VSERMRVPASYQKLHEPGIVYPFDGSPEARTWATLLDIREEALIRSAAVVINAYTALGTYRRSGEDFYLIAALLSHAGWGAEEELQRFLGMHRAEVERLARESR
jgi:hypothetical protein